MHDCNCDQIVAFYGAFQNDTGDVIMCIEYMDVGYVEVPHLLSSDIDTDIRATEISTGSRKSLVPSASMS
jgi:hypothetical protein